MSECKGSPGPAPLSYRGTGWGGSSAFRRPSPSRWPAPPSTGGCPSPARSGASTAASAGAARSGGRCQSRRFGLRGGAVAVLQPGFHLGLPTLLPLVDCSPAASDRGGHLRRRFPRLESLDDLGSPRRGGVSHPYGRLPVPPTWEWEPLLNQLQFSRRSPVPPHHNKLSKHP